MTNPNYYPTQTEILTTEYEHRAAVIEIVKHWKKDWLLQRNSPPEKKHLMIYALLTELSHEYDKPLNIGVDNDSPTSYYIRDRQTICLNSEHPSIITALHEFAHHILGDSETLACRWSVWLFKKTFPKAFERLRWDGHRLVKQNDNSQNNLLDQVQQGKVRNGTV